MTLIPAAANDSVPGWIQLLKWVTLTWFPHPQRPSTDPTRLHGRAFGSRDTLIMTFIIPIHYGASSHHEDAVLGALAPPPTPPGAQMQCIDTCTAPAPGRVPQPSVLHASLHRQRPPCPPTPFLLMLADGGHACFRQKTNQAVGTQRRRRKPVSPESP